MWPYFTIPLEGHIRQGWLYNDIKYVHFAYDILLFSLLISPLPAKAEGSYSFGFCPSVCPSVRPSHYNFKLSGLVLDVFWYIDLISGMWLYLDELQFKFEFRSGRMIFGWVMALELVFIVQILSVRTFFYVLWDIDLIFGMWLYLYELQLISEFRSGRMIFGWVMDLELVF